LSPAAALAAAVTRGPYLQTGTPTSIVVRWRTDVATDSVVQYGLTVGLDQTKSDSTPTTEHVITLTGLSPNKKYFYSVGSSVETLASGSDHFFFTPPNPGTVGPTRIWVIGDSGDAGRSPATTAELEDPRRVRDAYDAFTGSKYTDVWLMLGDNAYTSGTDSQYQKGVFDVYPERLRQTVLWPTIGNHDTAGSANPPPTLPYYQIFTLPTNGEAGGLASGTENYYSFDIANIHFVCLDSMTESRSPSGPMLTWLANDLAATTQKWIIAFWHHPPYSKGSHNSDNPSETQLREMRQNALPILEDHGVDLVLAGHSHSYERSFLMDGHYGSSSEAPAHIVDGGDGRVGGDGAYKKPTEGLAPHEGAVYAVAGSSGHVSAGYSLNHQAMIIFPSSGLRGLEELGSMVLDVDDNRLDARFLRTNGYPSSVPPGGYVVDDSFTIIKGGSAASIGDVSITEGDTGTKSAVFQVTLSRAADGQATVDYATADGSALAGADYTAVSGTLTFPVGVLNRTISVPIQADLEGEGNEAFYVDLTNPTNLAVTDAQGQGTIVDNDAAGSFEFGAATYSVAETGAAVKVTVERTGGSIGGVTVEYETSDGSATAALPSPDYTRTTGTLVFGVNQTSATFSVPVLKDSIDEVNETILLRLGNPTGPLAVLGPQDTAFITILDNDTAGKIQLGAASYSLLEPATPGSPPNQATITVKRIGGVATPVTVHYDVAGGSASPGADYTSVSGNLTFDGAGPSATTQTFTVDVLPDAPSSLAEGVETVNITLSAPGGGATLGTPSAAVLTILDAQPTVEFGSAAYSVKESAPSAQITVKRSGPLSGSVTIGYAATGGTASNGADYNLTSGTLTFGPNVASRKFVVPILKDALVEGPETVILTLTPLTGGASLGGVNPATLTIEDVPASLQFGSAIYSGTEPVGQVPKNVTISVKRSGNMFGTVFVDYAATGGTAIAGTDHVLNAGTLTFGPGVASRTFQVAIQPDVEDEGTETVNLVLSSPNGAVLGSPNLAVLRLLDNEPTVQFAASKYTASEIATKATISVRRTGSLAAAASVSYAVTGGTAAAGSDYTLPPGTLTFDAGVAARTITVTLSPDTVDEDDETVVLTLSNPAPFPGIALGTPETTTLTIKDNDEAGTAQFSAASFSVGEDGGTAIVTVTRTGGTASAAKVDYAATGGSAAGGASDYSLVPGTLTFGPGESTRSFTIAITNDGSAEGNESVVLTLSPNASGGLGIAGQTAATLWIVDDE
jgi:hypothetical protein